MIKLYIDKIVENGKREDMDCLSDMLIDLLYDLKERNYTEFKKYKNKLKGMAYDYKIDEDLAIEIVSNMTPLGEYWDIDTIRSVVGNINNIYDIYVVMNSLANDYKDVISLDDVDKYVGMTKAWIMDEDAPENKVWWYFVR